MGEAALARVLDRRPCCPCPRPCPPKGRDSCCSVPLPCSAEIQAPVPTSGWEPSAFGQGDPLKSVREGSLRHDNNQEPLTKPAASFAGPIISWGNVVACAEHKTGIQKKRLVCARPRFVSAKVRK